MISLHAKTPRLAAGSFVCLVGLLLPRVKAGSGLDAAPSVGKYFNLTFPATAPGSAGGWTVVDAFPSLSFIDPVKVVAAPRSPQLFVLGKDGYVWPFLNRACGPSG